MERKREVVSNSPLLARVEDKVQRLTLIHQGSSPLLPSSEKIGLTRPKVVYMVMRETGNWWDIVVESLLTG